MMPAFLSSFPISASQEIFKLKKRLLHRCDIYPARRSRTPRPRPLLVENDVVYNVALGSNMDGDKLRARAGVNKIKPLSEGVACIVEDLELSFQMIAMPPIEPVMAGAVPKNGATFHGVLCKLSREDYERLAKTEGIFTGNSAYEEREVLARPYDTTQEPVRVLVFALINLAHIPDHVHPSERCEGHAKHSSRRNSWRVSKRCPPRRP